MTEQTSSEELEAARARLETALSGLAQGVIKTKNTLDNAALAAEDNAKLAERVNTLEAENLKLHEQIARYALQASSSDMEEQIAILKDEKAALEQNYKLLKDKYADLQEASEAPKPVAVNLDAQNEILRLKQLLADMQTEKDMIKTELDSAIESLEPFAGEA